MSLAKVRSEAYHLGNKIEESDTWSRFNPFVRHKYKKINRARRNPNATYGSNPPQSDLSGATVGSGGVNHFDDVPSNEDIGTTGTAGSSHDQVKNAATNKSHGATGASTTDHADSTRQRKGLAKFFHKDNHDPEKGSDHSSDADSEHHKKHKFSLATQIRYSFFNSWLNVLLVFVPIGIALHFVPKMNPVVIFVVNFIAIIPLAGTLSYATEEIALRVGEVVGGLLNATFGNAVELIVSIIALLQGQIVIVQTSLIGSILSNLLLVMGMCFFFGGINRPKQHFNHTVAQTAASLLALAIGSLILPTAFNMFANDTTTNRDDATVALLDAEVSRGTAVLLLLVYICYLIFQLRTHEDMFSTPSQKVDKRNIFKNQKKKDKKDKKKKKDKKGHSEHETAAGTNGIDTANASEHHHEGTDAKEHEGEHEPQEEEREEPTLTWVFAIFTLVWSTVLVAVCAEFLVDAINEVVDSTGISKVFVGLILLPIVGNAAEHATALTVACKDKMDLAIGVAVGSSMQIALGVLPLIIIIGWIASKEAMTLVFDPFDIIILFVAVLLVNYLIADGESNWLEGVMLMILYIIIALAAWFFPNRDDGSSAARR